MTLPPDGLRTHHGGASGLRKREQCLHSLGEFRSLHVIRVAAKPGMAPTRVRRVRTRFPQAAKRRKVPIANAVRVQILVEGLTIELWMTAGLGNGPDIGDLADFMRQKERQKLLRRMDRVADCINFPRDATDVHHRSQSRRSSTAG